MDYIRRKIDERINFLQSIGDFAALKQHQQARFEYVLIYLMSYLWNKHLSEIEPEDKEFIFQRIIKPTIGDIVQICRKLDKSKDILKNNQLSKAIENYTPIRNEKIGHGYVFEDENVNFNEILQELYDSILSCNLPVLKNDVDLIYVTSFENGIYKGINYKSNGSNYSVWSCPKEISEFELNNLYGSLNLNEYFRLSPFIEITAYGQNLFIFNGIEEHLLGKVKYNRVVDTGIYSREWDELSDFEIENDGTKVKSINGTIRNVYENNFKKYIDIGVKQKVVQFLTKNQSSVCATLWGHGGVGKTATIQSICEDLLNNEKKIFDYIVFLSAKDRRYNYYTGKIEEVTDRVVSLDDIVKNINLIIFNTSDNDLDKISNFQGKVLIVIDDFETFPSEEKEKIKEFIDLRLNVNHHKVVITTRANIIIGIELQTNELNENETITFLLEVIKNENIGNSNVIGKELQKKENSTKIIEITSGRPLFIFQFAFILGLKGSVDEALKYKIKDTTTAVSFLYGRIYDDYLSNNARDIFVVISLLVTNDNLTNVVEKISYILNLEHDTDAFFSGVRELVRLKIIKTDDQTHFFEVYSKEILQIMHDYFQRRSDVFKGNCISRRDQVNKDRNLDIDQSLLLNANANRISKNEQEVIDNYKQIINRTTSSSGIRLQAVLNLAAYLVDRGNRELALKYLDEYSQYFDKNSLKGSKERIIYANFSKMWANYYWANGTKEQKEKAIKILLDYAANGFNYLDDSDLELSGILLTYRSIQIINDWQDLKEKRNYNEISQTDFTKKRSQQRQYCKDIHDKQGIVLYNNIVSKKFSEISSGARQNVIAGLYQFTEICIRLEKYDLANKICEFIFYCAPSHFHNQFKIKYDKIEWILFQKNPNYVKKKAKPKSKNENTVSDFGELLKEALK